MKEVIKSEDFENNCFGEHPCGSLLHKVLVLGDKKLPTWNFLFTVGIWKK